jgi:hypothetical protein
MTNPVTTSSVASVQSSKPSDPHGTSSESSATLQPTQGTEAVLGTRRHPSSPHHKQPRHFGPHRSTAAEMSKYGE